MKKKTMQAWFAALFIIGLVIGFLIPWDVRDLNKKLNEKKIQPDIFDVSKRLGQLENQGPYFKYSVLDELNTGGVELVRFDDKIPLHMHPNENHFVYIYKGKAKGTIGNVTAEVSAGQLVAIPAGTPHTFERIGDSPVEILLFSTPPYVAGDTVFLENQ